MTPRSESSSHANGSKWIAATLGVAIIAAIVSYLQLQKENTPVLTDQVDLSQATSKAEGVPPVPQKEPKGEVSESGKELFARHCAACHGENGNGQGIAATHLFPKPRDFRTGRFRLLSTANRVPSQDDLLAVIDRGMPGSSMPPWAHLTKMERLALVDEVQRLRREGARTIYVALLKDEQELTEDEIAAEDVQKEIEEYVHQRTIVGEPVAVPPIAPADEASILRGKDLFLRQGCNKCHGDQGRGDATMKMADDEGYPTTARDFTRGIFKGGDDVASLYRRISYGMPGTPMPSSQMTPAEMMDLANFILSLSDESTRQGVLQKRQALIVRRVSDLPKEPSDESWSLIAATSIRTIPLWWRNESHPELQVQAVHDTKNLMLRLIWKDASQDRDANQGAAFKDAVAVELYQGNSEPFVGMGARGAPVDVWYWDADRQAPTNIEDTYPRMVVDMYPFSEQNVATAEYQREGTRRDQQPEVSLPALASGNQITPDGARTGGSSLTGGGPGTVTFRIPKNQFVDAQGKWQDERWTVTMQRALSMKSTEEGVSLVPGDRVSIAFAVWNGSMKDRDGQKLVTIWNDLELE